MPDLNGSSSITGRRSGISTRQVSTRQAAVGDDKVIPRVQQQSSDLGRNPSKQSTLHRALVGQYRTITNKTRHDIPRSGNFIAPARVHLDEDVLRGLYEDSLQTNGEFQGNRLGSECCPQQLAKLGDRGPLRNILHMPERPVAL